MTYNHVSYLVRTSFVVPIYGMEIMYASIVVVGHDNANVTVVLMLVNEMSTRYTSVDASFFFQTESE